jgi:hypothetical protein
VAHGCTVHTSKEECRRHSSLICGTTTINLRAQLHSWLHRRLQQSWVGPQMQAQLCAGPLQEGTSCDDYRAAESPNVSRTHQHKA